LEIVEKLKDSSIVKARLLNIGADYYILAIKGKKEQPGWTNFFNSFVALDYTYPNKQTYVDTFYHFSVQTPVQPLIDPIYRAKIEKTTSEMLRSDEPEKNYWPNVKTVHFKNENTGEKITIGIRKYPQYYSISDTLQFWKDELKHYSNYGDYHLLKTDTLAAKNGCLGYCFYFTDTATSTILMRQSMIKDNYLYNVLALTDSAGIRNDFIQHFYSSFTPLSVPGSQSIFTSKMDSFYTHFTSKDSTIKSTTRKLIPYITYGKKGVPTLLKSMQSLSANDADYFDIKSKLIDELGYINDPSNAIILPILEQLYVAVGDTTVFKNALLAAFAHQQTKASFQQFKKYILADPPIFENEDEYSNLLLSLNDSIQHAAAIFPDILELTALDDYKAPIMNLLIKGVDSGYILPHQYEPYFSKILFNAKIELKKQWAKEEKIQGNAYKLKPNNAERNYENVFEKTKLDEYAALLIPFYDEQAQVQSFFSKLLQFKNGNIQRNTIALMLSKDKPVADSLVERIAANDLTRGILYTLFEKHGITNKFPAAFKQQLLLAKSYLLNDKNYNAVDSIELISTQQIQSLNKLGRVYFFKYRIKKSDDWKIGISGMQPLSLNEVSSDFSFCKMTDKKIKDTEPLLPQFQKQLKIMLYEKRKSALEFYKEENDNQYKNYND
ncbi:MAG: hypothetical protein ACOYKE_07430, partial [Ferruginibacter sp.]